uniref:(northern house mosquito) hypothetical protein n=1 Tax=Culex pipiens TaxID=7175 RepID=A0A8D8NM64_CULPI
MLHLIRKARDLDKDFFPNLFVFHSQKTEILVAQRGQMFVFDAIFPELFGQIFRFAANAGQQGSDWVEEIRCPNEFVLVTGFFLVVQNTVRFVHFCCWLKRINV